MAVTNAKPLPGKQAFRAKSLGILLVICLHLPSPNLIEEHAALRVVAVLSVKARQKHALLCARAAGLPTCSYR